MCAQLNIQCSNFYNGTVAENFNYNALVIHKDSLCNSYSIVYKEAFFLNMHIIKLMQKFPDGVNFFLAYRCRFTQPVNEIDNTRNFFDLPLFSSTGLNKNISFKNRFENYFLSIAPLAGNSIQGTIML